MKVRPNKGKSQLMKMQKVSLMAALAAGALIAFSPLVRAEDKPTPPEKRPPQGQRGEMAKERIAKMAEELKLTDEQKTKVTALLKEQQEKMRGMKEATPEERKEKMKAGREEMQKKMKEILTPEQFTKWEKLRKEGGPGGPGGPGRRGGPGGPGAEKPDKN
jgi:periplasmic protein CpxP/Spy